MHRRIHRPIVCLLLSLAACALPAQQGEPRSPMVVESLDGPVTQAEIDSLLAAIAAMQPATSNEKNAWSYGPSGQAVRALGLVYRISRDPRYVDQLVRYCDAELSERNDLAPSPLGQRMVWTGRVDPVWPNDLTRSPLSTGGEQGDLIGNLGLCARTILETPALLHRTVAAGDPHRFGATYRERARTYVTQADLAIDRHILRSLLDLSHGNHLHFAADAPYKAGTPVPWNQVMMFNYGFQQQAAAHALLQDDPARVRRYRGIVADNIRWFFSDGVQNVTARSGRAAYNWGYALPSRSGEDSVHARMDVAGLYMAFLDGDYPIARDQMTRLANTFTDIITLAPGSYAGRVDGTSGTGHTAASTSVKSGFLLLAEFRPDAYLEIVGHAVREGKPASAMEGATPGDLDLFARLLWARYRRHQLAPGQGHR